ncbi:MAG: hypothetical protein EZS28_007499 [Streblomastix strix]|uniref:Transmembrane protein n=1 Tax=Streblomastix strix TaxID=222440 RepID=A0A5J4WRF9_9EUKA|nr:MAG: hypothetical protein EZS28_007499 [Streblomastix strix]
MSSFSGDNSFQKNPPSSSQTIDYSSEGSTFNIACSLIVSIIFLVVGIAAIVLSVIVIPEIMIIGIAFIIVALIILLVLCLVNHYRLKNRHLTIRTDNGTLSYEESAEKCGCICCIRSKDNQIPLKDIISLKQSKVSCASAHPYSSYSNDDEQYLLSFKLRGNETFKPDISLSSDQIKKISECITTLNMSGSAPQTNYTPQTQAYPQNQAQYPQNQTSYPQNQASYPQTQTQSYPPAQKLPTQSSINTFDLVLPPDLPPPPDLPGYGNQNQYGSNSYMQSQNYAPPQQQQQQQGFQPSQKSFTQTIQSKPTAKTLEDDDDDYDDMALPPDIREMMKKQNKNKPQ